ncbi:DUF1990 family protein [Micromonospora cathayae]|uniref:DUF1990 domain-containing protein n=1 Tax=Micromonospora cathayae TaxID=3028804 RepID=A0ABY8A0K8_9ACTN|nr:DUF1990 domain-containing protein [Micromonospora sp. HUAS 3]WDZ87659.1 DUF1990 domain-containing protein [Micromonospora sp. HUAS 3]
MPLTYPHVGATRTGELPAGWRHVRHRVRLPDGCFGTAGQAVLTWRLHRAAGVRITADAPRAAPGVAVTSGLGIGPLRLAAPCEVVWTVDDEHRAGFGYGTLPGHPARGEEAFVVERDDAGRVWFEVRAFSRPDRWMMRVAGPAGRAFQHGYARWLGHTLRRLCRHPA